MAKSTRHTNHLHIHFLGSPTFPDRCYKLRGELITPFSGYKNIEPFRINIFTSRIPLEHKLFYKKLYQELFFNKCINLTKLASCRNIFSSVYTTLILHEKFDVLIFGSP